MKIALEYHFKSSNGPWIIFPPWLTLFHILYDIFSISLTLGSQIAKKNQSRSSYRLKILWFMIFKYCIRWLLLFNHQVDDITQNVRQKSILSLGFLKYLDTSNFQITMLCSFVRQSLIFRLIEFHSQNVTPRYFYLLNTCN